MTETKLEWDVADRMRKAMRIAGWDINDVAEELRVSRDTVSRWINGKSTPKWRDLKIFADAAEVPLSWLETGEVDLEAPAVNTTTRPGGGPGGLRYFMEPPKRIELLTFSLQVQGLPDRDDLRLAA